MATTRQRRAGAAPSPYSREAAEEERIYTEDDYAVQDADGELPDEWDDPRNAYLANGWSGDQAAFGDEFLPDEEEPAPEDSWAANYPSDDYADDPAYPVMDDFTDEYGPLDDSLLTDAERAELRRSRWQLLSGLADFVGVIAGTAVLLLLLALLIMLINWLINDVNQSFILLQKHL